MEGLELYSLRAFLPCGTSTDSEGVKSESPVIYTRSLAARRSPPPTTCSPIGGGWPEHRCGNGPAPIFGFSFGPRVTFFRQQVRRA